MAVVVVVVVVVCAQATQGAQVLLLEAHALVLVQV